MSGVEARVQAAIDRDYSEHGSDFGPLMVADVVNAVCRHYKLSSQEMRSERRSRSVSLPRQVAMFLARELTGKSMPQIGRFIGGRDHTTVLHGWRKIGEMVRTGDPIKVHVDAIHRQLTGEALA